MNDSVYQDAAIKKLRHARADMQEAANLLSGLPRLSADQQATLARVIASIDATLPPNDRRSEDGKAT